MLISIDVSPDGKKIAFPQILKSDDLHRRICIYDLDLKRITYEKISERDEFDPCFSKDGSKLLFCSQKPGLTTHSYDYPSHIKLLDLKTNSVSTITNDSVRSDFQPQFSSDNTKIVFHGYLPKDQLSGRGDIYLYDTQTKTAKQLTHENLIMMPYPCFLDNSAILINIENESNQCVYLAKLESRNNSKPIPITKTGTGNFAVMFPEPISKSKILCTVRDNYKYELNLFEEGNFTVLSKSSLCFSTPRYCQSNNTIYWTIGDIDLMSMNLETKKITKIADRSLFYQDSGNRGFLALGLSALLGFASLYRFVLAPVSQCRKPHQ